MVCELFGVNNKDLKRQAIKQRTILIFYCTKDCEEKTFENGT